MDQLAIHFALDGNMLHKDSDEARRQMAAGAGGGDGKLNFSFRCSLFFGKNSYMN